MVVTEAVSAPSPTKNLEGKLGNGIVDKCLHFRGITYLCK